MNSCNKHDKPKWQGLLKLNKELFVFRIMNNDNNTFLPTFYFSDFCVPYPLEH